MWTPGTSQQNERANPWDIRMPARGALHGLSMARHTNWSYRIIWLRPVSARSFTRGSFTAPRNPYPGQNPDPQPPIMITDAGGDEPHEEWDVLDVVDCRETRKYGTQYKARFTGNWDEWNANPPWQPWTDFKHSREKALQYHRDHPNKPPAPESFLRNDGFSNGAETPSRRPRRRRVSGSPSIPSHPFLLHCLHRFPDSFLSLSLSLSFLSFFPSLCLDSSR